jgi:hypothetical protein
VSVIHATGRNQVVRAIQACGQVDGGGGTPPRTEDNDARNDGSFRNTVRVPEILTTFFRKF